MSDEQEIIIAKSDDVMLAQHSLDVMKQWADGAEYDEKVFIERGRMLCQTMQMAMFEFGKVLIVLKEHMPHGTFQKTVEQEYGISARSAQHIIKATTKFSTPEMIRIADKIHDLGRSKLIELVVEDDKDLQELADGGTLNGLTYDDIDRMSVRELKLALREAREDSKAKDKVMSEKNAKIDELAEKLAKNKNKQPKPADVARELSAQLASAEVSARSEISKLKDIFDGLVAHKEAHGSDHTALMVGAINQLILDCEILRGQYLLPTDAPTGEVPAWLTDDDEPAQSDDKASDEDVPLPFDYEDDE